MNLRIKKSVVALLSIATLGIAAPLQASNNTSWIPTDVNYSEPGVHSFAFTDKLPLPFQLSVLQAYGPAGSTVCTSISDSNCLGKSTYEFNSILKMCDYPAATDCVEGVEAIDEKGNISSGSFQRYTVVNHLNAFPADSKLGIPEGGMPSIWSIPGAPHKSGNEYAVYAGINGNIDSFGQETARGSIMQLSLIPVVLKDFGKGRQSQAEGWSQSIPGIYYDYCATSKDSGDRTFTDCAHVNGSECLFPTNNQGLCYAEEAFGEAQKFSIQLRLAKEPTGWMHGRMTNPSIAITKIATGGVKLSVSAGATAVPMVYHTGTWSSLSSKVQDLWVRCNSDTSRCGDFWLARDPGATSSYIELGKTLEGNAKVNMLRFVNAFGPLPLEIMSTISPLVGDRSVALSSTWSMRTLSNAEMNGSNKCFTNSSGLKGIVTTNSTTYSAGPPQFKDGFLNYQVASPHFNPDGITAFKGNYSLIMRSDVARCLYGFSQAPISASISVISNEGTSDISTSVTAEKNGWLSLSANNFQFSSPIIQVKLSQESKVKSITITCVKGKTLKKITGTQPVCPKGYKQK